MANRLNRAKIQLLRAMAANSGWLSSRHSLLQALTVVLPLGDAGLIEPVHVNIAGGRLGQWQPRYVLTAAGRELVAGWRKKDRAFDVWLEVPSVGEVGLTVWATDAIYAIQVTMNVLGMDTGPGAMLPKCRVDEANGWPLDHEAAPAGASDRPK